MTGAHAAAVLAIYQAGIDEGNATFETRAPGWPAFTAARLPGHRFVANEAGQVAGRVAASATCGRDVYAGVVEHSVYVYPGARGQGIGHRLLEAVIASTEAAGIWTIQSGIFPENVGWDRVRHLQQPDEVTRSMSPDGYPQLTPERCSPHCPHCSPVAIAALRGLA
jgi:phosphinothricin acetyltransferase